MMNWKKWLPVGLALLAVAAMGWFYWQAQQRSALPEGFASGNGRIEAVEIDISALTAGRIEEIFVDEGDFIEQGAPLARMDTVQLEAQMRQSRAELHRAEIGIDTAQSLVVQREAERRAALAMMAQAAAVKEAADRRLVRSERLAATNALSQQVLDDDRAEAGQATAGLAASEASVAASEAAIGTARAQVVDAGAAVEAAKAAIDALQSTLDDAMLEAPRAGRVQYRVAQPGETLAAGGRVLNLVDLNDVSMTFFLPTAQAGRVALGAEVRLVLDAAPGVVIPATVSHVATVAQFTPKTVETADEREKLMFRIRAKIAPALLAKHIEQVKTGLPGTAYVRLDPSAAWPETLSAVVRE